MRVHLDGAGNMILEGFGRLERPIKILYDGDGVSRIVRVNYVKVVETRTEKRYLSNSRSPSRFVSERGAVSK